MALAPPLPIEAGKVDEQRRRDKGIELGQGEAEKLSGKVLQEGELALVKGVQGKAQFVAGEGIAASEVETAPALVDDVAGGVDKGKAVLAADQGALGVDQAEAIIAEERAGGDVILGHLGPELVRQQVEDVGWREIGPLPLQFGDARPGSLANWTLLRRGQTVEAATQQGGIKEGDIEEAATATGAALTAGDFIADGGLAAGKPGIGFAEKILILLQKKIHWTSVCRMPG